MTEPIALQFTYTEKEYISAVRYYFAQRYSSLFFIFVYSLVVLAGLTLIANGLLLFGGFSLGLGLGYLIIHLQTYFVLPQQYFRNNPKILNQILFEFSEEQIFFQNEDAESSINWNYYTHIWETPNSYFLFYSPDQFTLIPKRLFADELKERAFRELIARKISPVFEKNTWIEREEKSEYLPPANPPDWR